MRVQAGFLTLFSVLGGVTAIYDLPDVPSSHDQQFIDIFNTVRSDVLKRSTHDESFSLNFNVANQVLSSGKAGDAQLTVTCVECSTTGEVVASAMLPDISDVDITDLGDVFDDSMLGLTFNGVGATIDLGLTAAASGDFSVPLLILESPIGVSGPGFEVGVVLSLNLVLKVDGQVETEGGFKVTIPDGSSFIVPFDDSKSNVANFNGASASLLPITVDLPASITAALQLKVEAGVKLPDVKVLDVKAVAGASISIPEVILKESATLTPQNQTCAVPVSAELNINAGVFVDIGADIAGIDLGEFNPTAATTLFAASTSTCLKSVGDNGNGTAVATKTSASAGVIPTKGAGFSASSASPTPTTLVTSRVLSQGTSAIETPSSFAVVARTYARRSAYPITLQSLATPITNYAVATLAAARA